MNITNKQAARTCCMNMLHLNMLHLNMLPCTHVTWT
jgi:hypothetical protein